MPIQKSKKRRKVLVFLAIVIVLGGLTALAVFKKRDTFIRVETEKVTRKDHLTETVVANGRIQPVLQVKISAEVSGEIVDLPVKEGQFVSKGDLLAKIKPDQYQANRKSAEAGYLSALSGQVQAKANLRKAELDFNRNQDLFKHVPQLISDSELLGYQTVLELAKASVETSQHQVELASASLARADDDLSKTTLYSPLTGTVSKLSLQAGERVAGNTMMAGTEIMTLADLNGMQACVDIGEIDIVLIKLGQQANLEVDAFRDRKFKGVVTDIANSPQGGAAGSQDATKFQVKIHIDEKEPFRPGMSVTAEIQTRSRTNILCVPVQSVTTRLPKPKDLSSTNKNNQVVKTNSGTTNAVALDPPGDSSSASTDSATTSKKGTEAQKPIEVVFVVEGDHVKMVPVKRGINDETFAEISDGLTEGQEIVSGGYKAVSRELEDGKKIQKEKAGTKAIDLPEKK